MFQKAKDNSANLRKKENGIQEDKLKALNQVWRQVPPR